MHGCGDGCGNGACVGGGDAHGATSSCACGGGGALTASQVCAVDDAINNVKDTSDFNMC